MLQRKMIFMWLLLLAGMGLADRPKHPKPVTVIDVGETKLKVCRVLEVFKGKAKPSGPMEKWSSVFYAHVAGSAETMFPRKGGAKEDWLPVRIFPIRGSAESPVSFGPKGYCLVFERPMQKKRVNIFSLNDHTMPTPDKIKNKERLYITMFNRNAAVSASYIQKAWDNGGLGGIFVCYPADAEDTAPTKGIYFNGDRFATLFHYNLSVAVSSNYSDIKQSTDFQKPPVEAPEPVRAAIYIRNFLDMKFPDPRNVLHGKEGRLLESFGLEKTRVKVGDQVKVKIAFGLGALRTMEMVRLNATAGGFQRKKADIYYRADKPGKHIISVEAFCGMHGNGKFDFAERRQIEIVVKK